MANITLRPSSAWSEALLHRFDVALERLERTARTFFADPQGDFRQATQDTRIRRLAAHGCSGQALM
ncbi:MAG: hypothetical protein C0484_17690 [Rhodospirillum sp.]|jgi:hypothetical protein|nr:hypothetical protein [Rhodospirillum sp.]